MSNNIAKTTIALDSVGCKLNQAEIELLARQFAKAGYCLVPTAETADIYILNTCTVTHIADRKSRQMLRVARRQNPDAKLVVTGCYAERVPGELADIPGVDIVLGNEQKMKILSILEESGHLNRPACRDSMDANYDGYRTRAFIKVQDGCHNFCAYCIVPLVRGTVRSVPVEHVIDDVRERVANGYKEVVLTGTEIGLYRCNGVNLRGLLEHILAETSVNRLRLSSLQPGEISPGFIETWRNERLCPHFHLSLQSGSDGVLRRMKRRYSVAEYQQAVSLIRETVPDAAITTDIIVGFPGETDAEYQESYNLCRQMKFARIHVFPYSVRSGTAAAGMPRMIDDRVKKQRSQGMLTLAGISLHNYNKQFLGRIMPVLWEKHSDDGVWSGLTGNYIKVYTKSSEDLTNRLLPVKLAKARQDGVWGKMIQHRVD